MYEQFFELSRRPFPSIPDTQNYFPSLNHEEATALVQCSLRDGEGIVVVVGKPGVGKTLLCQRLLALLPPNAVPLFITNTHSATVGALLQSLLYDLSSPFEGLTEQELRLRLTDLLLARFASGTRTVLFIDEAHHLSMRQLEEIRLITNLVGQAGRAVQVVLVGQPSLRATLAEEGLEGFRQRVGMLSELTPLSADETLDYIRDQFDKAGGQADAVFTAHALSEIYTRSAGIPRRINQLCHRALLLAYAHESGTVDGRHIEAADAQLAGPLQEEADDQRAEIVIDEPLPLLRAVSEVEGTDGSEPVVVEVGAGCPPLGQPSPFNVFAIDDRKETSGGERNFPSLVAPAS